MMTAEIKPPVHLVAAIGIIGILIAFMACCIFGAVFFLMPSAPDTVDEYMEEYGGNPDVYRRILVNEDCAELQSEFDQADLNLKLQEPGTSQYEWGLGYMQAADQRMKEIGCYK